MVIRGSTLISLLLLCLGVSCSYTPGKEFFKEVAPPDPTGVTVNLNSQGDTVYIFQSTPFTFKADIGSRKIAQVLVYFNDKEISRSTSATANFNISSQNYADGLYPLRIDMFTSTGSGSLGDILGAEQFKITRQWIAYVDKSPPLPVSILSIQPADGTLKIKFQRYQQHNFQSYVLKKYCYDPIFNQYNGCGSLQFTDQNQTTIDEITYAGGKVRFDLSVKGADKTSNVSQRFYEYAYDPSYAFNWIDQHQVKATWRKEPFYRNFKKYVVFYYNPSNIESFKSDVNDTTMVFTPNVKFGSKYSAGVKVLTADTDPGGSPKSTVNIGVGRIMPPFFDKNIVYNKLLNKYFAFQNVSGNKLIRVNGTTLQVEQEMPMTPGIVAVSQDGQSLYVGEAGSVKRLDPLTFSPISTLTIPDAFLSYLFASNNNLLQVSGNTGSRVMQMPGYTVIKNTGSQVMMMSESGKYVLSQGQLLELDGSTFTVRGSYSTSGFYRGIFKDDNTLILVYSDNIKVLRIPSMTVQTVINTAGTGNGTVVYDPETDFIGRFETVQSTGVTTYYLNSLTSPTPVKTFEIGYTDVSRSNYTILMNNSLLCSGGNLAPLSYFYP